jgi:hypothetical protein
MAVEPEQRPPPDLSLASRPHARSDKRQATSDKRQATSDKRQAPARGPGVLPFALPWQQARPGPRLDPRLLTLTFFSVALHGSVRQRRFSGCNAGRIPTSNVVSLMSGFRLIAVVDNSAGVRSHGHGPAPPRRVGFRRPSVAPSSASAPRRWPSGTHDRSSPPAPGRPRAATRSCEPIARDRARDASGRRAPGIRPSAS